MKVLITGATSGMGKEMALYLLSLGHELYVVARNHQKLQEIYKDKKATIIALDLSKESNCYKLYHKLKKEHIDFLINNAGFGDSGNFTATNLDKELDMINVNIKAYHILTKLFLQDFVEKNSGRILNVASMAGFMPGPYMATYYATKAYILNLSLAIYEELKQMNSLVKISIFCPGPVDTNFLEVAQVHFNVPLITASYAAKLAIDEAMNNKLIIIPSNMKINRLLTKLAPIKLVLKINSKTQERVTFPK